MKYRLIGCRGEELPPRLTGHLVWTCGREGKGEKGEISIPWHRRRWRDGERERGRDKRRRGKEGEEEEKRKRERKRDQHTMEVKEKEREKERV